MARDLQPAARKRRAANQRAWRSFLWAADRSTAQAAYPRVLTGRASPPLLFGLAPRGVCLAANITADAVGSYPTVSPLPNATAGKTCQRFCLQPVTDAACAGGFVSVALSVAEPSPARPPDVIRRAALRSPDFPPGLVSCDKNPAIARPGHQCHYSAARAAFLAAFFGFSAFGGAAGSLPSRAASNWSSLRIVTPSSFALSALEPGSAPTTT
jgi:hypothetical protein